MNDRYSTEGGAGKTIEPATTLRDEGNFLRIRAELPVVHEEKIRIDLEKTSVAIVASGDGKKYKKVISAPCEVRFSKKKFSNGILEIILEKTDS